MRETSRQKVRDNKTSDSKMYVVTWQWSPGENKYLYLF